MTLASDRRLAEYYRRQLASAEGRIRRAEEGKAPTAREALGPAWEKRQRVWRHNSFLGFCVMADKNMLGIMQADSTTEYSKDLAGHVRQLLRELLESLKERIDQ